MSLGHGAVGAAILSLACATAALASEPFAGVEMTLVENPDGVIRARDVTDRGGTFHFSNVQPGAYCVRSAPIAARRHFDYGKPPNRSRLTVSVGGVARPAIMPALSATVAPVKYCFAFSGPSAQTVSGILIEQPSPLER